MNQSKLNELNNWLQHNNLDGAIITNYHSVAYLSGFESDPIERVLALVILSGKNPFLFGPALEVNSMQESGWPYTAIGYQDQENPWRKLAQHIQNTSKGSQRFTIEADNLTVHRLNALQNALPTGDFSTDITEKINQLRLIKTSSEIQHMLAAGQDADRAFEIGFQALHVGASELEVAAEIEYQLKKSGVPSMSFDTLVQFGDHAADPHGTTSNRALKANELVLFDLGTMTQNYASDASRTVAFGAVPKDIHDIYDVVLHAQQTAQQQAKIGMTAGELDHIARQVIEEAGYGQYFNHRLGHGLGSSVHEYPSIMPDSHLILQENMVFSIEPGIYIPGTTGIRIEDSGYLSANGFIPFTQTTKNFTVL